MESKRNVFLIFFQETYCLYDIAVKDFDCMALKGAICGIISPLVMQTTTNWTVAYPQWPPA